MARGFRQGYDMLKRRLAEVAALPPSERKDASLLEAVIGGNYERFETQREYLRQQCRKTVGSADDSPHLY